MKRIYHLQFLLGKYLLFPEPSEMEADYGWPLCLRHSRWSDFLHKAGRTQGCTGGGKQTPTHVSCLHDKTGARNNHQSKPTKSTAKQTAIFCLILHVRAQLLTDEVWRDDCWRAVTSGKLCNNRSRYQTVQLITWLYLCGLFLFQLLSVLYLWKAVQFSWAVMEVLKSYSGMKQLPFCRDSRLLFSIQKWNSWKDFYLSFI